MTFGYIPLSRKYFHHEFWNEKRIFHRSEAWLDLIRMASYQGERIAVDNRGINLKRGELIASIRFLAHRWQWSVNRVQRFLKYLEKEGMIKKRIDQGISVISLCNYVRYNVLEKKTVGTIENDVEQDGYGMDTPLIQDEDEGDTNIKKGNKMNNASNSNELEAPKDRDLSDKPKRSWKKILDHEPAILELEKSFPQINVRYEIEKMKDWLLSKKSRKKDYLAFARNWLRKTQEDAQPKNGNSSTSNQPLRELKESGVYDGPTIQIYGNG